MFLKKALIEILMAGNSRQILFSSKQRKKMKKPKREIKAGHKATLKLVIAERLALRCQRTDTR